MSQDQQIRASNLQLAAGLLAIAQQRMVRKYPFHAGFVSRWRLHHHHPTLPIDTFGVAVHDCAIHLYYNPEFVVTCSYDGLIGALHHEINHLLFGHVFLDPAKFADPDALMVAEEVTVNEWITEPLPPSAFFLEDFPDLPANEDTLTRYHRLAGSDQDDFVQNRGDSVQNEGNSVQNMGNLVQNKTNFGPRTSFDDHRLWFLRTPSLVDQITLSIEVTEAIQQLSQEQFARLDQRLCDMINNITNGTGTPAGLEPFAAGKRSELNWKRILWQFLRDATDIRPIYSRPPRRFPELVGIIPGRAHELSSSHILAVIDTSGSISSLTLQLILAEIENLVGTFRVTLVQCDDHIHGIHRIRQGCRTWKDEVEGFKGRGGTDLQPALAPEFISKINPDVILYFTDGIGPAPETSPHVPVIWCLTPGGQRPARWGRVVQLPH